MFAQIQKNQQVLLAEIFSFVDKTSNRMIFLIETVDGKAMFAEKTTTTGEWQPWFADDGIDPEMQQSVCKYIDDTPLDELMDSLMLLPDRTATE